MHVTPPRSPGRHPRDPARTRARILAAALHEFSAQGFAGARVDRIAGRARVNKRMLYHYFGDKDGLFRAILKAKLGQRLEWLAASPPDLARSLAFWFERLLGDADWVRLMEWEALGGRAGPVIGEAERRAAYDRGVQWLRAGQAEGWLPRGLDARHLLLSLMALTTFPLAFPQLTRLVTGTTPGHPAFRRHRVVFLRRFARALADHGTRGGATALHA